MLNAMLDSYMETALWSSTDDDGDPLDATYDTSNFTKAAVAEMRKDVKNFLELAGDLLDRSGLTPERIGHNFWLTRNGHGAGFWDEGLGDIGDKLTTIAHSFGEQYITVHRGKLHI